MRYLCSLLAVSLLLATCAWAQPAPNQPAPNQPAPPPGGNQPGRNQLMTGQPAPQSAAVEITPLGAFVLRNGVLAKFDLAKLLPAGTLELFGPLPARPVMPATPTQQDRDAMRAWAQLAAERTAPFAMLAKDDSLYIVVGNQLFRVNQKTMILDGKNELLPANAGAGRQFMGGQNAPPVLKLEGGMLFILAGQNFISVDAATGLVVNRATLPPQMQPAGNRNAGGAAGGGRGGRGGAAAGGGAAN